MHLYFPHKKTEEVQYVGEEKGRRGEEEKKKKRKKRRKEEAAVVAAAGKEEEERREGEDEEKGLLLQLRLRLWLGEKERKKSRGGRRGCAKKEEGDRGEQVTVPLLHSAQATAMEEERR
ncbi:hypothetical protein GW17_00039215 [Ensete ventricosum]|uniref:Uncharacterized protein n=1 Tax=Ensete ventricosum TaxID=4639 RepID=A0A444DIM4_ENSVE|nr:hypothetical protein GW17_00039215 [Ensete ventricosum]RZR73205.1 hypothetical protein BHM03_00021434 [Ensete ventricosum]